MSDELDRIGERYRALQAANPEWANRPAVGFGFPIAEGPLDDRPFDEMSWVELGECLGQLENEIGELTERRDNLKAHIAERLAKGG